MDDLIQVNLQIPAGALESLSRLTEQLRLLAETAERRENIPAERVLEQGENRSFDPAQFQTLRQETEMTEIRQPLTAARAVEGSPEAETATVSTREDDLPADVVRPEMQRDVYAPEGAEGTVSQNMEDPAQAGPPSDGEPAVMEPAAPDRQESSTQVMEDIPTVQADVGKSPEPAAVRSESESRVPDAETAWAQTPPAVRTDIAVPSGAGIPVSTGPETPRSRWTAGEEFQTGAENEPWTAESISQAFQRDERRYDNGFPLY